MDPNETLAEIRKILAKTITRFGQAQRFENLEAVASLFQDLDEWLSKGGFLPGDWAPRTDWEAKARGMVK